MTVFYEMVAIFWRSGESMKVGESQSIDSPEAMMALGAAIAIDLKDGAVLALRGGLGAGKTHFTKGVADGMGCQGEVTSPTFSLAHEYTGGDLPLFHFDFYRMDSEDEVIRIGWDDYLDAEGVVVVVEWPDKFPNLLPSNAMWLEIVSVGAHSRMVTRVK